MDAPSEFLAPTHALRRLAAFLKEKGSKLSTSDAATMAINQWIACERGQFTSLAPTPTRGYQWKTLFLPEGTELRATMNGETAYARVEGDDLRYRGRAVSPRQMLLDLGGKGRNAWREVWVLLPGERKWQPASRLRRVAEGEAPARLVSPAEAMSAAAACMSETLKTALALVEQANQQALPAFERRTSPQRRASDALGDDVPLD
ncbi:hypothetical protein NX773_02940 [Massilia solisilvae]|uniref:Uncharacterized protein n=1 Tax=Massilia solisilvae TaxID=1811225 RepID=A0ABT2BF25_9BURK|nr:hypothetical protein [Massilia solisilvae]MCS0607121.1 hypothetical protein [Massilia solisilvae]